MFDNLKKALYYTRTNILFNKGFNNEDIIPFDDEFYSKLNNTFVSCLPVSFHIKYLKPTTPPGKCYDRSLYMFFCFDDALLVRADIKDLELRYGKEKAGHGWIEIGDYVYDPSSRLRFKKDLYYDIYKPYNISKVTKEEYCSIDGNLKAYYDIINTKLEDFMPYGKKRLELSIIIPLIQDMTKYSTNEEFIKDVNDYIESIQYDILEINNELNELMDKTEFNKLV